MAGQTLEPSRMPPNDAVELLGVPLDFGAARRGSAHGPAALRAAGLAERLMADGHGVRDAGDLRPPPARDDTLLTGRANHASAIAAWTEAIHDRAYAMAKSDARPVFLGGDHSVSMGTISGVARAAAEAGQTLAVIWLDAHADYNTPLTSGTGNLHGMSVAFLAGQPSLAPLLKGRPFVPLRPADVHLVGLRDVDPAEQRALDASSVDAVSMADYRKRGLAEVLGRVLDSVDPRRTRLHVSLDLDFLDPTIAPGVGTGVPGGTTLPETQAIMARLADSGLVGSADLVELDPTLDPGGSSAALLAGLAAQLLGPPRARNRSAA